MEKRDEAPGCVQPICGNGTASRAAATFEFFVDGGVINFDQHGEEEGQSLSWTPAKTSMPCVPPQILGNTMESYRERK